MMDDNRTSRRRSRFAKRLSCLAAVGLAGPLMADEAIPAELLEGIEVRVAGEAATVEQLEEIDLKVGKADDVALDPLTMIPGFTLQLADEDLQKQIAGLNRYLAKKDWSKAFRLLTDLEIDQLKVMVPSGDEGMHVLVKEELQRQLLSLSPEGLEAFRLYFDGQASELFEAVKNHPLPGSEAQLTKAQSLVDRLLPSSIGGEAAALLGDLCFERGLFDQADRNWRLALEHGSATGQAALSLQAKRALAMQRAGKQAEAKVLYEGLQARYGQTTIQAGGEEVDAVALLGQSFEQRDDDGVPQNIAAEPSNLLPSKDAAPLWHLPFLGHSDISAVNQVRGNNSPYSPPADIAKFIPPVVADDQRVYFHWLGAVFALDRETGKLLWQNGSVLKKAQSISQRVQSIQGDPRNYRIALGQGTLLVTSTQNDNYNSSFILRAYNAENGSEKWSSDTRQDWSMNEPGNPQQGVTALLGQVLVAEGKAYAVVYRSGQSGLSLRCFDPANGEVDWTIPLGSAELLSFQYTQVSRMPQPTLLMNKSLLYVMTNNGALIAVDVLAREARWALRMDPPKGLGQPQTTNFFRGNQLGKQLEALSNTNGSGKMLIKDGTLYAKEHNGKTLYALSPASGMLKWSASHLKPDAKLVGVDEKRFYLMDRALQSYQIDGEHDLIKKNGNNASRRDHAGTVMLGDKILFYDSGKLRQLDTTLLDPAGKYENLDYLGTKGGHLYPLGNLLIAIDTTQITAFKILPNQ